MGEYCKKGDSLHVSGKLDHQTWSDKDTGAKRSKVSIACLNMTMLGGGQGGGGGQKPQQNQGGGAPDPSQSYYDNSGADNESPF